MNYLFLMLLVGLLTLTGCGGDSGGSSNSESEVVDTPQMAMTKQGMTKQGMTMVQVILRIPLTARSLMAHLMGTSHQRTHNWNVRTFPIPTSIHKIHIMMRAKMITMMIV